MYVFMDIHDVVGLPGALLQKLQQVQNLAACIIDYPNTAAPTHYLSTSGLALAPNGKAHMSHTM